MASEVLISISKDEEERAWLRSREKYILDTQSQLVTAKREGKLEGKREGKLEGKREAIASVVKNLKSSGLLTPMQIQDITGFSLDDIEKS